MAWMYLIFVGVLEVVWSYTMKLSEGFSRLIPSLITIFAMMISFWLLSSAMPMRIIAAMLIVSGLILMKVSSG